MIDMLIRELGLLGVNCRDGSIIGISGDQVVIDKYVADLEKKISKNKKFIIQLWIDAVAVLNNTVENGSISAGPVRDIFINSVRDLYARALMFTIFRKIGITDSFEVVSNSDSQLFSENVMSKFIDYKISIDWVDYLIRRDAYVIRLLRCYKYNLEKPKIISARGADGPYSRLDLPMEERVFEWEDIRDDMEGRTKDRQKQRRYSLGLERINDSYNNEGFYWREVRNEPYLFDDEDENSYPHRNLLFS